MPLQLEGSRRRDPRNLVNTLYPMSIYNGAFSRNCHTNDKKESNSAIMQYEGLVTPDLGGKVQQRSSSRGEDRKERGGKIEGGREGGDTHDECQSTSLAMACIHSSLSKSASSHT